MTIAILTFKRPDELEGTLPLLIAQAEAAEAAKESYEVQILVIDNDANMTGQAVVERCAASRVRYTVEPRQGISAARNRALREANSRLLVFIDDDEKPRVRWLVDLLSTWQTTGADVVAGRVVSVYTAPLDGWIEAGGFFERRSLPTGTAIDVAATNNLLLDLHTVNELQISFDEAFGLTGGGDTLFTRNLARRGARLVWCNEAVVLDVVPSSRATREWVLARAARYGNSTTRVSLRLAEGRTPRAAVRVRDVVWGTARVSAGSARSVFGRVTGSARHEARGKRTAAKGRGMLAGAAGLTYHEYSGQGWRRTAGGS